jgi:hemoglobin
MRVMSDAAANDAAHPPAGTSAERAELTHYERFGGMPFFERLVDEFYRGVERDDVLLRLYPEPHDLAPARRRLTLFLAQYWGGPTTYSDQRGHPKLRMRHMPFTVGPVERDHWLAHMTHAIETVTDDEEVRAQLLGYFVPAAEHLRNDTGLPISSRKPGT